VGYGIIVLLEVGCRVKFFWWEQDLLFLTDGKIDVGMRDAKRTTTHHREPRFKPDGIKTNALAGVGWPKWGKNIGRMRD